MLQEKIEWKKNIEKELEENRAFRRLTENFFRQQMKLSPVEFGESLVFGDAIHRKNAEREAQGILPNDVEATEQTERRIKELESGAPLKDGEIYSTKRKN